MREGLPKLSSLGLGNWLSLKVDATWSTVLLTVEEAKELKDDLNIFRSKLIVQMR